LRAFFPSSGKTETSKFIMQYISGVSGKSAEVVKVKERMLSSNPILEGFGNVSQNNGTATRLAAASRCRARRGCQRCHRLRCAACSWSVPSLHLVSLLV
jgi:hypothetical protein